MPRPTYINRCCLFQVYGTVYFWIVFVIVYCTFYLLVSVHVYYMGRYKLSKYHSLNVVILIQHFIIWNAKINYQWTCVSKDAKSIITEYAFFSFLYYCIHVSYIKNLVTFINICIVLASQTCESLSLNLWNGMGWGWEQLEMLKNVESFK